MTRLSLAALLNFLSDTLSDNPQNFLSADQRYKLGPARVAFPPNLDPECTSGLSALLLASKGLGRSADTVLVGPCGTKVMTRVMSDAALGRGRGGTNNNDIDPDVIMCEPPSNTQ